MWCCRLLVRSHRDSPRQRRRRFRRCSKSVRRRRRRGQHGLFVVTRPDHDASPVGRRKSSDVGRRMAFVCRRYGTAVVGGRVGCVVRWILPSGERRPVGTSGGGGGIEHQRRRRSEPTLVYVSVHRGRSPLAAVSTPGPLVQASSTRRAWPLSGQLDRIDGVGPCRFRWTQIVGEDDRSTTVDSCACVDRQKYCVTLRIQTRTRV